MNNKDYDKIMDEVMREVENGPKRIGERPFAKGEVVRIPLMRPLEVYIWGTGLEMAVYEGGQETPLIPCISVLIDKIEAAKRESVVCLSAVVALWDGGRWMLEIWTSES